VAVILAVLLVVAQTMAIAPNLIPEPHPAATPRVPNPRPTMPTLAEAQAWARRQLGATQYACLDRIVWRESRWNPLAENRRSGAFGLFQTYPASRLDSFGNRRDPMVQMRWGLGYIHGRYGTPCRAIDHIHAYGWF
jgi:hypothetical protein